MTAGGRETSFEALIQANVLQIGDGYRAKNEELGGNGIIFLRAGHVGDNGIDFQGVDRFHAHLAEKVVGKMAQPGDAVITTKGNSTGRVCYIREDMPPFVYSPHLSYWRSMDRDALDPRFLYYWSRATEFQTQLQGMSASTDMAPYLSLGDQRRLKITLPPINQQRYVGEVLGSLDDKIELNRRTNETLEAMARAVFRSWFVEFDPVRAKADGRKPDGLDAATAKLFPGKFEDSPLGPVPKGWRVVPLGDYVEVAKGLSYKGEGLAETGLALHNLNSVYEGGGYKHDGIKHYVGEYRPCHVLHPGDVIVANTEQGHDHLLIGYSALVPKRYGDFGLFTHHTYRVRPLPGSPLTPPFIHHLFLTSRFRGEVIGYTNGTTVNMLPADGLKRARLVLPPAELILRFTDFVTPLLDKAEANGEESRSLTVTRDTLLPKLLSGELRVGDAESFAEVVT